MHYTYCNVYIYTYIYLDIYTYIYVYTYAYLYTIAYHPRTYTRTPTLQTTEEDMFSNTEHSDAFQSFLECMGARVKLRGYTGYKGGLDITSDLTGTDSYAASYDVCLYLSV